MLLPPARAQIESSSATKQPSEGPDDWNDPNPRLSVFICGKPVFSVSPCLRGEWCLGEALVNSIAAYIVIATCAALGAKTGMA